MDESQMGGMQRKTWGTTLVDQAGGKARLVIGTIAANAKTFFRQMNADLVRTSGFQST